MSSQMGIFEPCLRKVLDKVPFLVPDPDPDLDPSTKDTLQIDQVTGAVAPMSLHGHRPSSHSQPN